MFTRATIVISTKNRKQDLAVCLDSCFEQTAYLAGDVDILVLDDGSDDQTAEMVKERYPASIFPRLTFVRSDHSLGYIEQRNRGARIASTPVIVSVDDDCEFISTRTIEQTLAEFIDPRVAAIAIPYHEPNLTREKSSLPDFEPNRTYLVARFVGCAHAVRRDDFLAVGGYRNVMVHQHEETDLAMRFLDRGLVIARGRADALNHYESPRRDKTRVRFFDARNYVLLAIWNVPFPEMLVFLVGNAINLVRRTFETGYLFARLRGLFAGYMMVASQWSGRKPMSKPAYRLFRRLVHDQSVTLEEVESSLRPIDRRIESPGKGLSGKKDQPAGGSSQPKP